MNSQLKRAGSRAPRPRRTERQLGFALGLVALCALASCLPIRMPMPKTSGDEEPQDVAPPGVATQVWVSAFTPTLALSPTFPPLITPTPSLTPVPSATALPTATPTATPTRMAAPTRTPWPTLTPTPVPTVTVTSMGIVTYTATLTHTAINPGPTPPAISTPTRVPAESPTPTRIVEPTVAYAAEPSVPVLLWPVPDREYANPITFRWEGRLRAGEAFQVTARHGETGQQIQTSPMQAAEWTYALPKEWVGAWWWSVWVVRDGRIVATSPEWSFWLNPHRGPGPQAQVTSAPQATALPPRTRQSATPTSVPTRPPLGN